MDNSSIGRGASVLRLGVRKIGPKNALSRVRVREGRCYELAFRALLDVDRWSLVHASVLGAAGTIGHAWLVRDGVVYDPVLDAEMPEVDYARRFRVAGPRIYSVVEAARMVLETGHYGPWYVE
jgi:hypothetical protein